MKLKAVLAGAVITSAALLLSACAIPSGAADNALANSNYSSVGGVNADAANAYASGAGNSAQFNGQNGKFSLKNLTGQYHTIYFAFDSNSVQPWALKPLNANSSHANNPQPTSSEVIDAFAAYLLKNPNAHITLAGNTDKRGSRDYNLALGERRAKAVEQELKLQGVSGSQVSVISYGKEEPVALGSNENAYSQNRRVSIKIGA